MGISIDQEQGIQLKPGEEENFVWPSGSFYLHYPVKTQSVVGFGKNNGCLGKTKQNFKKPAISDPNDDEHKHTFIPVEVYGSNNYSVVLSESRDLFETGDF